MKTYRPGRLAQGAALGAILLLAGCSASGTFTPPPDPMVGQPAPKFTFHSVHKRSFPSTNFMGKTLVVVFMRPGQVELPTLLRDLERLHHNPAYATVQFMAMSPEDDPLTEPYWIGLKNNLPIALDFTHTASRYGAGSTPLLVVVDYKGVLRMRVDGYVGAQYKPRFEATRKLIREVEEERTRPKVTR